MRSQRYANNPIKSWDEVNWEHVRVELGSITVLARELQLWVVLGSAHPLTLSHWPHNSLNIISNDGELVTRYDKRICSHTEATRFYTRGNQAIKFEVDGYTFGCLICIEVNFPTLLLNTQCLVWIACCYPLTLLTRSFLQMRQPNRSLL